MEDYFFFPSPVVLSLARAALRPVPWPGAAWQSPAGAHCCAFDSPHPPSLLLCLAGEMLVHPSAWVEGRVGGPALSLTLSLLSTLISAEPLSPASWEVV